MARVTIKDIAKEVGVSPATVSNVLNGRRERVSEKTAEKVLQVVRETGYRPNVFARGLAGRRSDTLGLVVANVASPLFAQAIAGAEEVASRLGYHVILCNSHDDEEKEVSSVDILVNRQVDGVIFISSSGYSRFDAVEATAEAGVPFVVVNRLTDPEKGLHILIENQQGTYEATRYLIDLGHTNIGCIHLPVSGPMARQAFVDRFNGFKKALSDHNLTLRDEWVQQGVPGGSHSIAAMAVGYRITMALLESHSRPTALVCGSDHLAVGAIRAAAAFGLRVPEDLAVIGHDDELAAAYIVPPLSTVRQPMNAAGARAAEALVQALWKGSSLSGVEHMRCELIVRNSTSPRVYSDGPLN